VAWRSWPDFLTDELRQLLLHADPARGPDVWRCDEAVAFFGSPHVEPWAEIAGYPFSESASRCDALDAIMRPMPMETLTRIWTLAKSDRRATCDAMACPNSPAALSANQKCIRCHDAVRVHGDV
jgi:hypothetical protein